MSEVKKVGSKYVVFDHVSNNTKVFRRKADADDFAEELKNPKPTQQPQEENLNPNSENVN